MIKRFNKLLLILFLVTTSIICISCSEEIKKINVEFIVDEASYNVEIDNGSILTYDIVPVENINYILGLYYDESYEKSYNYEKITTQVKIYVKYEDLTPYIAEVINSINTYCETLEYEHIKYSYMFIDDEISKAIEMMESANNKESIDIIKQNCISEINNLILTEEEYNYILECYSLSKYYVTDDIYFPENEITLNFYLGKFDNKYVVNVDDQYPLLLAPGCEETIIFGSYLYIIQRYWNGWTGICFDGNFYELKDGDAGGKLGENYLDTEQFDKIIRRYSILVGSVDILLLK